MLNLIIKRVPPPQFSFFPSVTQHRSQILSLLSHSSLFYLIDPAVISARLAELQQQLKLTWGENFSIAYSFKTNYEVAAHFHFDLAEVVSSTELDLAKAQKYSPAQTIFNGPHKGPLSQVLSQKIILNIDNFEELQQLIDFNRPIKSILGIRLNTNRHPSRFGFNIESGEAQKVLSFFRQHHLTLSGLHLHLGSDIQNPQEYLEVAKIVTQFIKENSLIDLKYIDFGGGFPSHGLINHSPRQSDPDIGIYLKNITQPLLSCFPKSLPQLILEPGRFLVDDASILICRPLYRRLFSSVKKITLNVTNTMLPSVWYRTPLVQVFNSQLRPKKKSLAPTILDGASCQETDVLFNGTLPPISIDDYLVFYCVGAYNQSQASNFIFPPPLTFFI